MEILDQARWTSRADSKSCISVFYIRGLGWFFPYSSLTALLTAAHFSLLGSFCSAKARSYRHPTALAHPGIQALFFQLYTMAARLSGYQARTPCHAPGLRSSPQSWRKIPQLIFSIILHDSSHSHMTKSSQVLLPVGAGAWPPLL